VRCCTGVSSHGRSLFILVFTFFKIDGGVSTVVNVTIEQGKFLTSSTVGFSFWKETLLTCFICGLFNNMYQYIGSQDVVQRYNSTKSTAETNKSLWINAKLALLVIVTFYGMGTVLYVYYKQHPALLPANFNLDSLVPYFIIHEMPAGIAGLLIAAIFAAAQSTISSSLNSISACYITDFQKRLHPDISEKRCVRNARIVIIVCGVFGILAAAYMVQTNKSQLLNAFNALLGMFGGPIAGIFLLGIFTKRANGSGAFLGAFLSVLVEILVSKTDIYFMYYGMVGVAVSFIGGYLFSFLFQGKKNIQGLTYSTINEEVTL
jgi:solute:Na+ symporter, SSS family